jgi:hypothetical protein
MTRQDLKIFLPQPAKKKTQAFERNDLLFPCAEVEWLGREKAKFLKSH